MKEVINVERFFKYYRIGLRTNVTYLEMLYRRMQYIHHVAYRHSIGSGRGICEYVACLELAVNSYKD